MELVRCRLAVELRLYCVGLRALPGAYALLGVLTAPGLLDARPFCCEDAMLLILISSSKLPELFPLLFPLVRNCGLLGHAKGGTSSSGVACTGGTKFKICPSWSSSSSELVAALSGSSDSFDELAAEPDDSLRVMSGCVGCGGVDVLSMSPLPRLDSSDAWEEGVCCSKDWAEGGGVSVNLTPLLDAEGGSALISYPLIFSSTLCPRDCYYCRAECRVAA